MHRTALPKPEITESALIENIDQALASLHALKQVGCQLALDDFGTGYSSLSYLKRLPIDELKIDRSFIVAMHESEKDAGIVDAIIRLAHLLGLVVVTEGVEDEQTAAMLKQMGNDVIQGLLCQADAGRRDSGVPCPFQLRKPRPTAVGRDVSLT